MTLSPAVSPSAPALQGLTCPRCGGTVAIPEGQAIVICPYCDQRSIVACDPAAPGQRGVRRYQAPTRVTREQALSAYQRFLGSSMSIARDAKHQAQLTEVFLVHLPFWAAWARGVAWAFGQQRVGSGDNKRYEPREKQVIKDLTWNGAACEVGEFGVRQVGLQGCPLEPFDPAALHRSGMVFEPVGSPDEALESARKAFEDEVSGSVKLSRTAQLFTRLVRPRLGLVYYPMWVLRYLYHGRAFQVVVDAFDGQVLYGKAPGSVFFRAAVLVGGMAVGAVVTVDVPTLLIGLSGSSSSDSSDGLFGAALVALLAGVGILYAAFRKYRYGEHYEFHRFKPGEASLSLSNLSLPSDLEGVGKFVRQLEDLK